MRAKQIGKLLIACAFGIMFSISLMAFSTSQRVALNKLGVRVDPTGQHIRITKPLTYVDITNIMGVSDTVLTLASPTDTANLKRVLEDAVATGSPTAAGVAAHLGLTLAGAPGFRAPLTAVPIDAPTIAAVPGKIAHLQGTRIPGVVFGDWKRTVQLEIDDLNTHIAAETTGKPGNVPPNLGAARAALHDLEDLLAHAVDPNAGPGGDVDVNPAAILAATDAVRDLTAEYATLTAHPVVGGDAAWRVKVNAAIHTLTDAIALHRGAVHTQKDLAEAQLPILQALLGKAAIAGPGAFDAVAFKARVRTFVDKIVAYSTKHNGDTKKAERVVLDAEKDTLKHDATATPAATVVDSISIPASSKIDAYTPKKLLRDYLT